MLLVGQIIKGPCCYFGNLCNENETVRIEAVGCDWIVARNEQGKPVVETGTSIHKDLEKHLCN